MMLAGLAWRNLWRQPRRTWLSIASIAFAALVMVFLLSFQMGVYATMKENVLRIVDGFAQLQPTGYRENPSIRKNIDHPAEVMSQLALIPGVTHLAPRASSFAILSNGKKSFGAAVIGVDPNREPQVSRLQHTIVRGRYLAAGDDAAIVIGSALARNLDIGPGDTITLLGEARDRTIAADVLKVVGVFSTGTDEIDRQLTEMPLSRFQSTFSMQDAINTIVISGDTLEDVEAAFKQLGETADKHGLIAVPWQKLQPGLDGAISLDLSTSMLWYVSLVIVVVFIILNTLLMSVLERTQEFGVLLAVGMQPDDVGIMIWLELLFLALVGLGVGIAAGSAITLVVSHYGLALPGTDAIFSQWGLPGRLYPRLGLASVSAGPLAMAICIVLSGIIPFRHVSKLEPVSAMRGSQ